MKTKTVWKAKNRKKSWNLSIYIVMW